MDFSRPPDGGDESVGDGGSGDSRPPGRAEIEAALERILASRSFSGSPRQQALLRHIVIETLEGRADRLKEYSLAIDVFGRSPAFDPRVDSIVRVQASRLRNLLADYSSRSRATETVRIEIPAGGYVATFERVAPDTPTPRPRPTAEGEPPLPELARSADQPRAPSRPGPLATLARLPWMLPALLAAATLALLLLILSALGGRTEDGEAPRVTAGPSGPVIFVAQYQVISGPAFATSLRNGLQYELIDSLSRFPELSVLGVDTVYGTSSEAARLNPFGADFILSGSVQADDREVKVNSQLVRASDYTVLWTRSDTAPMTDASGLIDIQSRIAGDVAGQLGQPYGVIQERLKQDASTNRSVSFDDYLCVLSAYDYSRYKSPEQHAKVRACLEEVVKRSPGYSPAWAKLSWMYGDEERFHFNPRPGNETPFMRAREAAEMAVRTNASSAMAHQYLALAQFHLGDDRNARGEIGEALRLNPNNSEILADAAQIKVLLGDLEEGRELAEKAIQSNPGHPPWYHGPLAIYHVLKGNKAEALRAAQAAVTDGSPIAGYMLAAALRLNGDDAKADQALASLYATHPEALEQRDALVKSLRLPDKVVKLIFGA